MWWPFRRADGDPWGLACLWNTWTDKASGEIVESYAMLTLNADAHPIMRRMHKPEKAKFGGPLKVSDAQRLRALEGEHGKLKRLLANSMLEVDAMREVLSRK